MQQKEIRNLVLPFFIFVIGLSFSLWFYRYESKLIVDAAQAKFERRFSERAQTLEAQLLMTRNDLQALGGLFLASNEVSRDEFIAFVSMFKDKEYIASFCWHDVLANLSFEKNSNEKGYCQYFDPLSSFSIVPAENLTMMLSMRAPSRSNQKGFVSLVVDFSKLLTNTDFGYEQHLLVNDGIKNELYEYDFESGALSPSRPLTDSIRFSFDRIGSFSSTEFIYGAEQPRFRLDSANSGLLVGVVALIVLVFTLIAVAFWFVIRRKQAVEKLVLARTEELSQFAYRTSHDLKAPLSSISGIARMGLEDIADGEMEDLGSYFERIEKQSNRLSRLIVRMLELAQADLKTLDVQNYDLSDIVSDAVERCEEFAKEKAVTIEIKVSDIVMYPVDREKLLHILENLITNGIKYQKQDSSDKKVTIGLTEQAKFMTLEVEDNGIGIAPEHTAKVFEAFSRFHPEFASGSGFGLAIVKRYVERIGANIECFSEVGRGTKFLVTLPLKQEVKSG